MQRRGAIARAALALVPAVQLTAQAANDAKGVPTAARMGRARVEYDLPDPCGNGYGAQCTPSVGWKVVADQELALPAGSYDFHVEVTYQLTCHSSDCDPGIALADDSQYWWCANKDGQQGWWFTHQSTNMNPIPSALAGGGTLLYEGFVSGAVTTTDVQFSVTCTFEFQGGAASIVGTSPVKESHTEASVSSAVSPEQLHVLVVGFSNEQVTITDVHISVPNWEPTTAPTMSPTPSPATSGGTSSSPASAKGDPHLQNINGQRFDLMRPGRHVLLHIPRGADAQHILLRVEAEVQRLGPQCGDMYFQHMNITGAWVEAKHMGILHFHAGEIGGDDEPTWMAFGAVQLKVVRVHWQGINYLNLYAKHLGHTGFTVGGLLGEDDHTYEATPDHDCVPTLNLHGTTMGVDSAPPNSPPASSAEATLA